MKTLEEIIKDYDFWSIPRESFSITREEYKVLRDAALASQSAQQLKPKMPSFDEGYPLNWKHCLIHLNSDN